MSITTQIQALIQDRADIRNALIAKGVTEASSSGFDDFSEDILKIFRSSSNYYLDFTPLGYSSAENFEANLDIYRQLLQALEVSESCSAAGTDLSYMYYRGNLPVWFPNLDSSNVENFYWFARDSYPICFVDRLDLSSARNVDWMFAGTSLTHVGEITSSNSLLFVADMFRGCPIEDVPLFNTSKVIDFSGMFWGSHITSVPNFQVTSSGDDNTEFGTGSINMNDMFRDCKGLSGSISSTIFANMGGVKNAGAMFLGCSNITGIEEILDLSSLTNLERPIEDSGFWGGNNMFGACINLQNLKIEGLRVNLGSGGLADCPLTSESINYIVEHLGIPEAGTDTFYVGSSSLAKLSSSSIASAEAKGWTISA